jgi:hypothetical protein
VTIDNLPTDGLLIIDAANVVGSVPDGWWRDRAAATVRLRDRLAGAVAAGLVPAAVEVILVVEGAARDVAGTEGIRVFPAPGTGDDSIVGVARDASGPVTVVTADRGLRDRLAAVGARVIGPRTMRQWLDQHAGSG